MVKKKNQCIDALILSAVRKLKQEMTVPVSESDISWFFNISCFDISVQMPLVAIKSKTLIHVIFTPTRRATFPILRIITADVNILYFSSVHALPGWRLWREEDCSSNEHYSFVLCMLHCWCLCAVSDFSSIFSGWSCIFPYSHAHIAVPANMRQEWKKCIVHVACELPRSHLFLFQLNHAGRNWRRNTVKSTNCVLARPSLDIWQAQHG